jgi:hypothetical protein
LKQFTLNIDFAIFNFLVAPQGFIATDFTRVMSVSNRYTPMCTPVFLLPEWLVRFPGFLGLASTSLDIISMSSEITIKHNGLPDQGFGSTAMRRRLAHTECLDSSPSTIETMRGICAGFASM